MRGKLHQRTDRNHLDAFNQRCLGRVDIRHVHRAEAALAGEADHRQDAVRVPQVPIERQLAEEDRVAVRLRHLPGRDEDTDGDRQIVRRSLLA